jgi:hypothetical protein
MTHSELMQYATAFLMAQKLFPAEIEARIAREMTVQPMPRYAVMRVQAYRNMLKAQAANSPLAIADVVVSA